MPIDYSLKVADPSKVVRARGSNMRFHYKNVYETAAAVRGMSLKKAQKYLDNVVQRKDIIPFRKHTGNVGRKAQVNHKKYAGATQGRWPVKAIKLVQDMLRNAESNAQIQNIEPSDLFITHISVQRAPKIRRRTYRAHGRIGAYMASPCHIEVICTTRDDNVAKAQGADASSSSGKLSAGETVETN